MDSRPSSKKSFLGLDAEAPALSDESFSACQGITIAAERRTAPLSTFSVDVTWTTMLIWVDELVAAQHHCRMSCQQARHDKPEGEDEFECTRRPLAGLMSLL